MFLTTRCPRCGTAFEVAPDQLRMRGGLVRCGECGTVFDGKAGLAEPAPADARQAVADAPVPVHAPEPDSWLAQVVVADARPSFRPEPEQDAEPAHLAHPVHPASAAPVPDPAPVPVHGIPPALPSVLRTRAAHAPSRPVPDRDVPPWDDVASGGAVRHAAIEPARDADGDDRAADGREPDEADDEPIIADPHPYARSRAVPDFMDDEADARSRRASRLWGLAALLALIVLALQALVVFRVSVATAMPSLRPTLEALCRPLGCAVGYERRAERISITASSLQPAQAGPAADDAPARLMFSVTLRNRYLHPQPWPALMLDLRDFSDTVVVRRALLPAEYLPADTAARPLGAGAEVSLTIPLTVTGARVSGYQVDTFHP